MGGGAAQGADGPPQASPAKTPGQSIQPTPLPVPLYIATYTYVQAPGKPGSAHAHRATPKALLLSPTPIAAAVWASTGIEAIEGAQRTPLPFQAPSLTQLQVPLIEFLLYACLGGVLPHHTWELYNWCVPCTSSHQRFREAKCVPCAGAYVSFTSRPGWFLKAGPGRGARAGVAWGGWQ